MNIKEIKSLAQIMESSGLTSLSVTEGDVQINLERKPELAVQCLTPQNLEDLSHREEALCGENVMPQSLDLQGENSNNAKEIKSPMVGIFYAAPSPDAEPYVKIGSKVKKGDVLCIIEAMKLMNEILSEEDGEIADVCASSGQIVEYAQPLFKLL